MYYVYFLNIYVIIEKKMKMYIIFIFNKWFYCIKKYNLMIFKFDLYSFILCKFI